MEPSALSFTVTHQRLKPAPRFAMLLLCLCLSAYNAIPPPPPHSTGANASAIECYISAHAEAHSAPATAAGGRKITCFRQVLIKVFF